MKLRTDPDSLYREGREQEHVSVSAYAGFAVAFVFAIFDLLGNLWDTPNRDTLILCGGFALFGVFLWLQARNMIIYTRSKPGVITPLRIVMNAVFLVSQIFVYFALAVFLVFLWSNLVPGDVDIFGIHFMVNVSK